MQKEYKKSQKEIAKLIEGLNKKLALHASRAQCSNDWGYVGDLGRIVELLTEANNVFRP